MQGYTLENKELEVEYLPRPVSFRLGANRMIVFPQRVVYARLSYEVETKKMRPGVRRIGIVNNWHGFRLSQNYQDAGQPGRDG